MSLNRSLQTLIVLGLFSQLPGTSLVRIACADPSGVVDLEGDTHHNPPASTTDTASPVPSSSATDAESATENRTDDSKNAAQENSARQKLKLRAGERVGADPRGAAQVLGMALQEGTHNRVKVVEVAMNSPAFDAGIMKGDEVVAFQGFRGESYRKWIDGMRRLTTDTSPGLKIPVLITRDDKQMTVQIEVPEKPVRPSTPRALGSPLTAPGVGPAPPTPGSQPVAVANGGNNVAISAGGPFGEFFGGEQAASPNERAMAQIVRIGGQPSANPGATQTQTTGAAAAPINGAPRIGMAGFRDDPSGMVVMVDVGALPAGNYTVGISDASVLGGAAVTGVGAANPNVQAPSQTASGQSQGTASAANANPATRTADATTPTGEVRSSAVNSPTGEVRSSAVNSPTGQVPSSAVNSPTGQVNPPSTASTGQSGANNTGANNIQPQGGTSEIPNGAATGTLGQIGTLTIDQSGTGRMQQKVEGMQVRTVVGQAIVIYSQGTVPPKTLPANLNGNAASATRQGVVDAPTAGASQVATDASGSRRSAAPQNTPLQPQTAGSSLPVAGGIIQLIGDRRPPATTGPQATQTPAAPGGAVEQPANATPPTGRNQLR